MADDSNASPARSRAADPPSAVSPRWLSDVSARVGRCVMFGLKDAADVAEAGAVAREIGRDWRELVAGSEGFLTGRHHRGLFRQEVVWGEMVRG